MAVSPKKRKQARQFDKEQERLISLGRSGAIKVMKSALGKALALFRRGKDPIPIILKQMDKLKPILVDAMIVGYLAGYARTKTFAPLKLSFEKAKRVFSKRAKLSTAQVKKLSKQFSKEIVKVMPKAKAALDASLRIAAKEIIKRGVHIKAGTKMMKNAMVRSGFTGANPHLLETLVRTQIHTAYAAGRWQAEQAPEIDEILTGYTYVTVGDDRVRDDHAGFDGVTLPKDDPFWDINTPPNGWNCRCGVIPEFSKIKKIRPKAVNGVKPVAGKGFEHNPGKVFANIG